MSAQEIDWRRLAEVATGILGWSPADFWAATPAEFWTAWDGWRDKQTSLGARDPASPVGRADLASLMTRFPDRPC